MTARLPWGLVVRLGLVQAALGAIVVLMTATLNRVMVVELGLPASVPGGLVFLHFAVQMLLRPRLGFLSDRTGRRVPWILAGIAALAVSGIAASASTLLFARSFPLGLLVATLAFVALGVGGSAAGTPLLALLSELVPPAGRARAAATLWLMMIAGFVVTTIVASALLEPFSYERLVGVTALVGAAASVVSVLATRGLELRRPAALPAEVPATEAPDFRRALAAVWAEPTARTFAVFILVSMLAYSAQDLILEPFAGQAFGLSPAATTRISSLHQGGMLVGMLAAALLASRWGSLRRWATAGCAASAGAFVALAATPSLASLPLLKLVIGVLGVANGAFAIGAIGSMMSLSAEHGGTDAGLRMGVFGGAQAIAHAVGGLLGAVGSDLARSALGSAAAGYAAVFVAEAALFAAAALLAVRAAPAEGARAALAPAGAGDTLLASLG